MKYLTSALLSAGAFSLLFSGCSSERAEVSEKKIKVETSALSTREFRQDIRVQAVIEPVNSAVISSRISGTVDELKVGEGFRVKSGDVLFLVDQKNLKNQLVIAQQSYRVAVETCKTAKEDMEIANITLRKAELDYDRNKKLRASNAISQTAYETAETDWQKAQASCRKVQAVYSYNQAKVDQAAANLEIARKNFADSIVRAPFSGVITEKLCEAGEFVSTGKPVFKLEGTEELEVSARISALYYDLLSSNTEVRLFVGKKYLCQAKLTYLSPAIDPLSRTFEVKAKLPKQSNLISGMLCDMSIIIASRRGSGLPSDAIIARAGGKNSVFVVKNGVAKEIQIQPGFANDGFTEILDAEKLSGDACVISGQYFLNDGSKVELPGDK